MGMYARLRHVSPSDEALLAKPGGPAKVMGSAGGLQLDKAWHGIHFLLTGEAWEADGPLGQAIMGGAEVGEDMGYGAARYLTPGEVGSVAKALAAVDREALEASFDAEAFCDAEIYPEIWDEDPDAVEYLMTHFDLLRDYYAAGAAAGHGMLVGLS